MCGATSSLVRATAARPTKAQPRRREARRRRSCGAACRGRGGPGRVEAHRGSRLVKFQPKYCKDSDTNVNYFNTDYTDGNGHRARNYGTTLQLYNVLRWVHQN